MDRGRRSLLRSVAIAGSVGLAGCFGGPSDGPASETPTGTDPGDTSSPTRRSPTGTPTTTATATPTRTPVRECADTGETLCSEPVHLLAFDDAELDFSDGTTTTITGRVYNPYLFEVTDVEVTLEPPDEDWTITPAEGPSVGTVPSTAEREVQWEVSVPRTALGEYDLASRCTYAASGNTADVTETFTASVVGE